MHQHSIAEDCGRFFEIGFNIGILTYIRQHAPLFQHHLADLYQHDLRELHFPEMAKNSFKRHKFTIDQHKRKIASQWFRFFLLKGFLAGLNFFHEYIQSLQWQADNGPLEIVYFQCSFCGENSLYTNVKTNEQEWSEVLTQFTYYQLDPLTINLQEHQRIGRFLKADTLLLLKLDKDWRLLCVDLSVFSISSDANLRDPNSAQVLRELLMRDLGYLRSKSVFANLSIDTASGSPGFSFSKGLDTYFTAFKHDDKESAKLIQAGSYAFDLYTLLKDRKLLSDTTDITFNIIGYTDRGINAMTCTRQNVDILATCAHIYQHNPSGTTIQQARQEVLETIRANVARSFADGETFTNNVLSVVAKQEDGVYWVEPSHCETIDHFVNPSDPLPLDKITPEVKIMLESAAAPLSAMTLRDAHEHLIMQELASEQTFVFLTGNPGIGKTTAIVKFLSQHREEGFLLLYISPRKQVNIDIINKFRDPVSKDLQGDTFAMTTNASIIHNNGGCPTVHYYAARPRSDFRRQGLRKPVDFIDAQQPGPQRRRSQAPRLTQLSEERIWDHGETVSGVLNSLSNALYISLRDQLSRQLIATIATQSLKKLGHGEETHDTLVHLKNIFRMATKNNRVIPAEMRKLSSNIKHLFIMIDEVTGDEGGVAFLEGIRKFVKDYELTQHGFNTKVIVADASIVDHDVIKQHIQEGASAYEPDKIYFRNVTSPESSLALSLVRFPFYRREAVAINSNSYPARRLSLTYHLCLELLKYDEEAMLHAKDLLREQVQQRLIDDIDALFRRQDVPQIIVYIQDKKRLAQLIEALKERYNGHFEKNQDYVTIHANISENDKKDIERCKDNVRVVFMTASASRGLSFTQTTHILVDVPRFEVEQNLMEIIQVIYRGRGDKEIEQREKELHFYLSERTVYYDTDSRTLSLHEGALNLFNILLILKTAIMTRIVGYGQVGRQKLMIIPIGGKSVLVANETYIGTLERLITEVRREYTRHYDRPWLKEVYQSLRQLLGQADFHLLTPGENKPSTKPAQSSYLSLLPSLTNRFSEAVYNGLHCLLDWEVMEPAYFAGGLLIVSAEQKQLQEHYLMNLTDQLRRAKNNSLYRDMQHIYASDDYPASLRQAMKKALDLLDLLNDASPEKIQRFTQDSWNADQYYSIPLLALLQSTILKEYFSEIAEEPEENSFRWLLAAYARTLYPITSVLPIGDDYGEFPFLLFRSFNLKEIRHRIFSSTHLLISNEMNVLNMLLSYRDERGM